MPQLHVEVSLPPCHRSTLPDFLLSQHAFRLRVRRMGKTAGNSITNVFQNIILEKEIDITLSIIVLWVIATEIVPFVVVMVHY